MKEQVILINKKAERFLLGLKYVTNAFFKKHLNKGIKN